MPQTRGDITTSALPNTAQEPTLSEQAVYFGVSQRYDNQLHPTPIHGASATSQCLDHVRQCVGEELGCFGRLIVAPSAMVTGNYGQETTFIYDAGRPNANRSTVSYYAKAARKVEDETWSTEAGREKNLGRIRATIVRHENAMRIINANRGGVSSITSEQPAIPIPDPTPRPIPDPFTNPNNSNVRQTLESGSSKQRQE